MAGPFLGPSAQLASTDSEHFLISDLKSETSGRACPSDVPSDLTCSNPASLLGVTRKVSVVLKLNTWVTETRQKAEL